MFSLGCCASQMAQITSNDKGIIGAEPETEFSGRYDDKVKVMHGVINRSVASLTRLQETSPQ
jgi:hypothetical protein